MARIVQEINLEVAKPNLFQAIVAKQNDYGSRFLKVTFVNSGEKIHIEPTLTATINAERPDGLSKRFEAVVNDDGTVTAPLVGWMLELQGLVNCDISVMTEDGRLTTTDFSINVNEAACSDSDISADEDYDILKELIVKVEKMEEEFDPSNYVTNTQFADNASGNAGVVRIKSTYGITSGRYDGNSPQTGDTLLVLKASENQIKHKTGDYNPIVPSNLDYAVKVALTDSKLAWDATEKSSAQKLLGIDNSVIIDNASVQCHYNQDIPICFNKKITPGKTYQLIYYNIGIGAPYYLTAVAYDDYGTYLYFFIGHPSDGSTFINVRFQMIGDNVIEITQSSDHPQKELLENKWCLISLIEVSA